MKMKIPLLVLVIVIVTSVVSSENECNNFLGIKNGVIKDSMIKVSSSYPGRGKEKIRLDCCKGDIGAAWCPANKDKHPYVEIHLPKAQAVSGIRFQTQVNDGKAYGEDFMTKFNLKFIPVLGVARQLVEFNKDIPSIYNESMTYSVRLIPTIVTDTIRIEPTESNNGACFRMELLGCEPADLCTSDYCYNDGKCIGQELCECKTGFFGNRCQTKASEIKVTRFRYMSFTKTTITTSAYQITYQGKVSIKQEGSLSVLEFQPGSTLQVPTKERCFKNLDQCQDGFTYGLGLSLEKSQNTGFYILNGGDLQKGSGVQLLYQEEKLYCTVATSTSIWQITISIKIQVHVWYNFEISWSKSLGLKLLNNGKLLGSVLQAANRITTQASGQLTFQIGHGISTVYKISEMRIVPLIYSEAVRAGITEAIVPATTTALPSTSAEPTTVSPCKTVPTGEDFHTYDLGFKRVTEDKIDTPDLNIVYKGDIQLMLKTETPSIVLKGTGEYLEIPTECISCLNDLVGCQNGFTIQAEIKFYGQEETIIVNSGIETGESGLQLEFSHGNFKAVLQKGYDKWLINANYQVSPKETYLIQLSWAEKYGLQLFVNGYLVSQGKHLAIPFSYNNITTPMYIGKAHTDVTSKLSVSKMMIWTATRTVLVEKKILPELLTHPLPTTQPPTTIDPNLGFSWNFASINSTKLVDRGLEIEVKGMSKSDKDGVYLQSSQQYLQISQQQNTCTGNLDLCTDGITFEFEIKFFQLKENTVIMSTGGENPNTPGVAVIYRFGQIQVVLSTKQKSWYSAIPREYIILSEMHRFLISWSHKSSLEIYLNEKFVSSTTRFVHRTTISASYTGTLYLGHSFSTNTDLSSVNCEIKSFHIWHITVDILIQIGICHCQKPTPPPQTTTTTTSAPVTTTLIPTTKQPTCPSECVSISDLTTTTKRPRTTTTRKPTTTTRKPTTTTRKPTTTTRKPTTTTRKPTTTTLGIPDISGSVTVKPLVNSKGEAFLSCSVQTNVNTDNIQIAYTYKIIGKNKHDEKQFKSNKFENLLAAKDLNENILGKQVTCSVYARYLPNGKWSQKITSNVFTARVEVKTKGTITTIEGESSKNIEVKSNVPPQLLCPKGNKGQCHVQLVSVIEARKEYKCSKHVVIPQIVIGWTPSTGVTNAFCGSSLTVENWEKTIVIPVKATVDGLYDRDTYRYLRVDVVISGSIVEKTETYIINNKLKVIAINRDYKAICASVNDPHITTFDGLHYNNFQSGEYILYRHKTGPYEVRALYQPCSKWNPRGPSCNCGVAVKSGDDVITLSGCSGGLYNKYAKKDHHHHHHHTNYPITVNMFKNGQLTPGTRVRRLGCGQKYEVVLPTGAVVTVQSSYLSFINIWVKASAVDYGQSQGLCGIYNRNKKDDLTSRSGVLSSSRNLNNFLLSWRATRTIFTGVVAQPQITRPIYCSCVSGYTTSCSNTMDIFRCPTNDKYDITRYLIQNAQTPRIVKSTAGRKRRAVEDEAATTIQTTLAPIANITISMEKSEEYCEEYLRNSTAVKNCENITQTTNYTQNIADCSYDLHVTGDTGFATAHVDDIINQCVTIATSQVSQYSGNDTDTNPTRDILTKLCTEDCGPHGNCQSGVCVCEDGFTGATCEVGKTTKPEIIPVNPDSEPCDINVRDCSQVNIMGINFVDSPDLSCHYQPIKVTDRIEVRGSSVAVKANYMSMYQIGCPLPTSTTSAYISISNDGHTISDVQYLHVVHDSSCFQCTVHDDNQASCSRKAETCSINGQCYDIGQTNPKESCQICDPNQSQSLWSTNTDPKCRAEKLTSTPGDESELSTLEIALIAACGVLGFIVLVSVVVICKQRNAASLTKKETDQDKLYRNPPPSIPKSFDNPEYLYESEKL